MPLRESLTRRRYLLPIIMIGLLVGFAVILWVLLDVFRPLPPRTVTMVTGPPGGAYHEYGELYREALAKEGFELKLLPTTGAVDNLARLNDPSSGVSIGFVQGGLTTEAASPGLESLGTIFYEPLWFFCRECSPESAVADLKGRRISIGPVGSGTQPLVLELMRRNGISPAVAEFLSLPFEEGSRQLLNGEIDGLLILASWKSPVVRRLLAADGVDLMNFPHADAYVALYPYLNKLVIPAGVGDMVKSRPPTNRTLLATKASLVVRTDVHPAIQYLLLDAAEKIHSGPGIFQKNGEFPAAQLMELPLSDEARRYYRYGPPFLQRYLPFWLAVLLGRSLVMLLPLLGILYPLLRFMPVLYGWKMQRRILRLYSELREVEQAWEEGDGNEVAGLVSRLERLEYKVDHLWVPVSSMGTLYMFKEHIALVRERLGSPRRNE